MAISRTRFKGFIGLLAVSTLLLTARSMVMKPVVAQSAPTSILSPVIGSLQQIGSSGSCTSANAAGAWCFNQHQSGAHVPDGGVGDADDTYAWDANLNPPGGFDSDDGKPVYAVSAGVVAATYGGSLNASASGSEGQVLIEHTLPSGGKWWSGYLHMEAILVSPGVSVTPNTILGNVSNRGVDDNNNHLHFVVYTGSNTKGGLKSFNATITPRFESCEDMALPSGWTMSSAGVGGTSPAVPNILPTHGNRFCFIDTRGSTPTGNYGGTVGTTLLSSSFALGAGEAISIDLNFLTNNGTDQFHDFAFVQLVDANNTSSIKATIFNGNTTAAFAQAVPAVGGPAPPISSGVTLTPSIAFFDGVEVGPVGGLSYGPVKFGGGNGGSAGWMTASYTPGAGTYRLFFVVSDAGDAIVDSGLAFDNLRGGTPTSTGGTLSGTVYKSSVSPANTLGGAWVQVCRPNIGCNTTLTNTAGGYSISGLPAGNYVATAFPPAGQTLFNASISGLNLVANGALTNQNIILTGPMLPPPGTSITSSGTSGGLPAVVRGAPRTLTTQACAGGQASYQLRQGTTVVASGLMVEGPSGTYTATVPGQSIFGEARFLITINCPNNTTTNIEFDVVYIDPSGTVKTPSGTPISGATVTLLRSDFAGGPFAVVPDGSGIMAAWNRDNPDTTDGDGTFAWDVIAGFYKVRAEKAFCTAPGNPSQTFVESSVLTIPPPATGLDLRLNCPTDTIPPTTAVGLTPLPNADHWNNSDVAVELLATDNAGGSGVKEITYSAAGVQPIAATTVPGSQATFQVKTEGQTDITYSAKDNAGNTETPQIVSVLLDKTAPTVKVTGVTADATYLRGAAPVAGCDTTDALSGVKTQATLTTSGGSANGTGSFAATCAGATDVAGNPRPPESVTYFVAGNINAALKLTGTTTAYNATPVTGCPFGVYTITGTWKNTSTAGFKYLSFVVAQLSNGNLLKNADGGPAGVGARLSVAASALGADSTLTPAESFKQAFQICLVQKGSFTFFVDVFGVDTATITAAAASAATTRGRGETRAPWSGGTAEPFLGEFSPVGSCPRGGCGAPPSPPCSGRRCPPATSDAATPTPTATPRPRGAR